MTRYSRKIALLLTALQIMAYTLFPKIAFAQLGTLTPPNAAKVNISDIIFKFVDFAIGSGVVIFLLLFIWGCLQWITSEGEKGSLAQSRGRITSGAIGLILLATSYAVMFIVKGITYNSP